METQTPTPRTTRRLASRAQAKALYWLAAAAQAIATALDLAEGDQLKTAGQFSLVLCLVLLATSGAEVSKFRALLVYIMIAVAIGLFVARFMARRSAGI